MSIDEIYLGYDTIIFSPPRSRVSRGWVADGSRVDRGWVAGGSKGRGWWWPGSGGGGVKII